MISKIKLFFGILLFFLLSLFVIKPATASAFTLSGNVKDSVNTNISGATVDVRDLSNNEIANTTTDSSGNYSITGINSGTYNIKLTPPSGSNYSSVFAPNYIISTDTVLNFIFSPIGFVTFSGHLYDSLGNPLANQTVRLSGSNGNKSATTANDGSYSIQVIPGTYTVNFSQNGGNVANIPQTYSISTTVSFTQDTIVSVTVPANRVTVLVQDPSANPVSGSTVSFTPNGTVNLSIPLWSGVSGSGFSSGQGFTTDNSGTALLMILPTNISSGRGYTITANPPSGSQYLTNSVSNLSVMSDFQQTIMLQQPVVFSGHLYDPLGNPLPNQTVKLTGSNATKSTTTASDGSYSIQIAPGTYTLNLSQNNRSLPNISPTYSISANFSLTQDTVANITIPANTVTVHVQDAAGNPISGVSVAFTPNGTVNLSIPL